MISGIHSLALLGAWMLAIYVGAVSAYMLAVAVGSWFYRARKGLSDSRASFAVIVPAHNEELGIAATLGQLRAVDYPAELVRIVVIADNCTDATAAVARSHGAEVLERHDLVNRGKGQALGWALAAHPHLFKDRDLIAFIDADMSVDSQFFKAMAAVFAGTEVLVAQGRYIVSNPRGSGLAAIGYASYCYVNHVRPAGRGIWGGSSDLKGSGMVFRSRFLLPRGWNAHSIAEDVQLGKDLMLEGIRIEYVPDARVESDIPSTLAQVRVQQSRWEGGKRDFFRSAVARTFRALISRPSALLMDAALDLLVPPLSMVILVNLVGLGLSWWTQSLTLWVFITSLGVFAFAVLSGLIQNRAPAGLYWRLIAAPLFIVWKLVLLLQLALAPGKRGWQRTPRDPRQP